jgi:hypothetical protein
MENDVILPTNILELDSVVRFFSGHARSQEHFESSLPVKQAATILHATKDIRIISTKYFPCTTKLQ